MHCRPNRISDLKRLNSSSKDSGGESNFIWDVCLLSCAVTTGKWHQWLIQEFSLAPIWILSSAHIPTATIIFKNMIACLLWNIPWYFYISTRPLCICINIQLNTLSFIPQVSFFLDLWNNLLTIWKSKRGSGSRAFRLRLHLCANQEKFIEFVGFATDKYQVVAWLHYSAWIADDGNT